MNNTQGTVKVVDQNILEAVKFMQELQKKWPKIDRYLRFRKSTLTK